MLLEWVLPYRAGHDIFLFSPDLVGACRLFASLSSPYQLQDPYVSALQSSKSFSDIPKVRCPTCFTTKKNWQLYSRGTRLAETRTTN